ncbi:MAG: CRISPR system precrRNA processing endoribonuclease RAMP protein Cas6 [Chloroflexi bacterium]|nr:MAG: CRISPR system precrRNA processing endoribonuclease RAMP protein Cas6 [Chloroflexota bacterium]
MLTSLVFKLKSPAEGRLPASVGRAAQAVLLDLLARREPALANTLHTGDGPRPYTASNLVLGVRRQGSLHIAAGQEGWLRFTGLSADTSRALQALAADPPPSLTVLEHPLTVTAATLDPAQHPWAGHSSYQDLAAPFLLGGARALPPRVTLEFAGPTTFKSGGRFVPVPLPELVFGSLLARWQAFAPIALHPEIKRFAAEMVVLSRYKLRSRATPYKQERARPGNERRRGGATLVGFTGQATFVALNRDRYWLNMLHLLAAFSFYSGVGYQTAAGLGQVRPANR